MATANGIAGGRRIFVTGGPDSSAGPSSDRLSRGDRVTSLVRDRRRGPTEKLEEPAGLTYVGATRPGRSSGSPPGWPATTG